MSEGECPTCKGAGELEGSCGCTHGPCGKCGDAGIIGLGKCPCCNGEGTIPPCDGCPGEEPHLAHHSEDASCCSRDGPDWQEDDDSRGDR